MVNVFWTFHSFPGTITTARTASTKGPDGRPMWALQPPPLSLPLSPPPFLPAIVEMAAVIPKHLILFHKARRFCIILSCIYMLLVLLGATPFAQAQ
jgi:hypothetical protein